MAGVRGKVIRAAAEGRSAAKSVSRGRTTVSRLSGIATNRSRGRVLRSASRDLGFMGGSMPHTAGVSRRMFASGGMRHSTATVAKRNMNPIIKGGVRSSRMIAAGAAGAYGIGAIARYSGPAADKGVGPRSTGVYEF